ncbi:hypothetical protein [Flammeovirga sp. EKP202]|uniref:hypothetical protein n=1 Tax=Flammeovirga sp. EKP202 TaxID=2770592 RepID=UPI00165F9883|nr:hypothetical protein [Flammeovirga sp. EKP202]MBD0403355.1 hypothetical protein [Flammeovirga sp. EKP202]
MYSVREIYTLREEGKYQEAFITARGLLELSPNDEEIHAAMAWVLYDMLKVAQQENEHEQFLELYSAFVEYIPTEADRLQYCACLSFYDELRSLLEQEKYELADQLLLLLAPLSFHPQKEKPKPFYQLLELVMHFNQYLPNFLAFIRSWRLSNLQPQHYQTNGQNMSIAERVHWLVGQHLYERNRGDHDLIAAYVKQLDLLLERRPQFHHIKKIREKLINN